MLLTFTSFFFEKFIHKDFPFFKKNFEKMKKSEDFSNFWFKKKTGKCQQHETNMILCLLNATDIYQIFFEKFIHKDFTLFKKNVNMILCLLNATDIYQFFLKNLFIKTSLFSRKMLKK